MPNSDGKTFLRSRLFLNQRQLQSLKINSISGPEILFVFFHDCLHGFSPSPHPGTYHSWKRLFLSLHPSRRCSGRSTTAPVSPFNIASHKFNYIFIVFFCSCTRILNLDLKSYSLMIEATSQRPWSRTRCTSIVASNKPKR